MKCARYISLALSTLCLVVLIGGCGKTSKEDENSHSGNGKGNGSTTTTAPVEIILETESMTAKGVFTPFDDTDSSGGKAMRVPQKVDSSGNTVPDGALEFSVSLKMDASVTIWCRVRWDDTCSNSFTLILPNGMTKTVTGSTLKKWVWVPAAKKIPIKAGTHKMTVLAREYGAQIDQVLVTDDHDRVPRGIATNLTDLAKE